MLSPGAFSTRGQADTGGPETEQCSWHPGYVGYGVNLAGKAGKTFTVELFHILKIKRVLDTFCFSEFHLSSLCAWLHGKSNI